MWDFDLSASIGAMVRTAPFIILRMLVYFGIALLYIIATGLGSDLDLLDPIEVLLGEGEADPTEAGDTKR